MLVLFMVRETEWSVPKHADSLQTDLQTCTYFKAQAAMLLYGTQRTQTVMRMFLINLLPLTMTASWQ